jgi:hypothetical protein
MVELIGSMRGSPLFYFSLFSVFLTFLVFVYGKGKKTLTVGAGQVDQVLRVGGALDAREVETKGMIKCACTPEIRYLSLHTPN